MITVERKARDSQVDALAPPFQQSPPPVRALQLRPKNTGQVNSRKYRRFLPVSSCVARMFRSPEPRPPPLRLSKPHSCAREGQRQWPIDRDGPTGDVQKGEIAADAAAHPHVSRPFDKRHSLRGASETAIHAAPAAPQNLLRWFLRQICNRDQQQPFGEQTGADGKNPRTNLPLLRPATPAQASAISRCLRPMPQISQKQCAPMAHIRSRSPVLLQIEDLCRRKFQRQRKSFPIA